MSNMQLGLGQVELQLLNHSLFCQISVEEESLFPVIWQSVYLICLTSIKHVV